MPTYTLFMYNPAGEAPEMSSEDMAAAHKRWATYTQDLKDAGLWVANQGLAGVESATTVRVRDGETQVTDGPFAETKEVLAGFFLIEAPDLDTALEWAAKIPTAEYGSVEVRPAWG